MTPMTARLLGAACAFALLIGPLGRQAAGATAAPPTAYQPPVVGIYHPDASPRWLELDAALRDTGRVSLITPAAPNAETFLRLMRSQGGRPEGAYAVVPSLQVGRLDTSELRTERKDRSGGGYDGQVSVDVYCPLTLALVIHDAASGRVLERITRQERLSRALTYAFTERTPADELRTQTQFLRQRAHVEAMQTPEQYFGRDLQGTIERAMGYAADDMAALPLFRLHVAVAGWDARTDRVMFNVGRDMRVRFDDGFRVMQAGRQIGYVKVRELGDRVSAAQPLYLRAQLDRSARVEEDDKHGHQFGLRALSGLLPMAKAQPEPVAGAGLAYEFALAPLIPVPELHALAGGYGLYGPSGPGGMVDLGLAKKVFFRQLAVRASIRAAVLGCGGGVSLGGTGGLAVEHHLDEHLFASVELDAAWLRSALVDATGPQVPSGYAWSLSPLGRAGLTWAF